MDQSIVFNWLYRNKLIENNLVSFSLIHKAKINGIDTIVNMIAETFMSLIVSDSKTGKKFRIFVLELILF